LSLRVLFLTESFHPVLGGGESHIRSLSRRLVEAGLAATVVTRRSEASWSAFEMLDGVAVIRVPPPGPARRGKYAMVPAAMAALHRERSRYDVLVVRGTRVLGAPGLLAARMHGRPVVLQAEVNGEMSGEVYTWGTRLQSSRWRPAITSAVQVRNLFLRDADAFVAMSRRIRDEFLEAGVSADRLVYIPHGVDLNRFRPAFPKERLELRQRLGLPGHGLVATYTGRLLRGKGLDVLIEAFARVAGRDSRAHLLLVGSGAGQSLSIEEDLRRGAAERGLESRVTFAGRVENVEDYLRASDAFVFPSEFEALGLSLVEAAACGLPAVAARTGGIVDVVEHERSGYLIEPGDATALAENLEALLAEPDRGAALGARAREIVRQRFDLTDSVDRYRALFNELHRGRGERGRGRRR
jgi:glycosyltransferase involved in cell wall biosynthesis